MKKELKYFIYVITTLSFLIFVFTYYFSDRNKKHSYRTFKLHDEKILEYNNKLPVLENDTNNVIEYVSNDLLKSKKKYKFWELIFNDK
tara:strand:+ start:415 stop:678 length:264 start_codon:yes stop_codon:yes gene_type:complete